MRAPVSDSPISKSSGVALGLVLVVLAATGAGARQLGVWQAQWDARWESIDRRLNSIESKVENGTTDRWRGADMLRWVHRLRKANPDMDVPEPFTQSE